MDQATDGEVLARCRNGDAEAFGVIVRKYQPEVLAIAWSVLGRREEALDAAQEVFIQCYRNLDRYDSGREFKNWLCGIAYKRSLDRRRKLTAFRRCLGRLSPETSGWTDPGPEPKKNIRDTLGPLLQRLGAKERAVLLLKVDEEKSYKEIADIIGGSEGAARVHYFNAKRKLKKWMGRKVPCAG